MLPRGFRWRGRNGFRHRQTLTKFGAGFRYQPQWSPDSKKIAFVDQAMRINLFDFEAKTNNIVGRQLWQYHDELSRFRFGW